MKKSAEDAAKHGKAHGAWWLEAFNQMNPSASPSAEPSSSGEDARKRHDAGADDRKGGGVSMLAAMGGFRSADSSGGGISSGSGMHAAGWGGHGGLPEVDGEAHLDAPIGSGLVDGEASTPK